MPTLSFQVKWLDGLSGDGTEQLFWDIKQPGLGLRLSPKGERTFVASYRVKGTGKRHRVVLGPYGTLTLDQARERARKYVNAALDGIDLYAQREALADRLTFKQLTDQWLDLHVRPKRAPRSLEDYENILRRYLLPKFGTKVAEEISHRDVLKLHKAMENTTRSADYAVVVGKMAINFGIKAQLLPEAFANPFKGVELYGYEGRERFLSPAEAERVGEALTALEEEGKLTTWSAAAIRLLILTGARKSEILTLRWDWVDLDRAELNLPISKTGKKRIDLNEAAREVLAKVPKLKGNPFVIVGQKPGTHMVSINTPWQRVLEKAEVENCRIHDLRHSFASFAASNGLTLQMVGKLLGHKRTQTTARYAHLFDDARKAASEAMGSTIGPLINKKPEAAE